MAACVCKAEGPVRMQGEEEEEEESGGPGGKKRGDRKKEKKERKKRRAAGERGDEEICYPQDSCLHARHRVVRAHTERGFSSTS